MSWRAIGHYCFPCWIKASEENDDRDAHTPPKRLLDPYAAGDSFRQGERYLFGLFNLDTEYTAEPLSIALDRFEAARDYGSALGAAVAGIFYECAISMTRPDYARAYKYYEEAAELGEPLGKCLLASMPGRVETGAIPGDYRHRKQMLKETTSRIFCAPGSDALKWLKEAADRHQVGEAVYLLASCIEQGVGVPRADPITAVGLYREAAMAGVKTARRMLAQCYLEGRGVEQDPAAGKYWLIRAINDNGDPMAMAMLAANYEAGVFPPDDHDRSEFLNPDKSDLRKMTAQDRPVHVADALEDLKAQPVADVNERSLQTEEMEHVSWQSTSMSETEIVRRIDKSRWVRNERRDHRECFYWARRSAELGCVPGVYQLARCHEVGIGVAVDLERCVQLYREAATSGHAPALFSLACFYCSGCVVERRDSTRALELLKQAAESGYTPAMISLATLFTLGSQSHVRMTETPASTRFRVALSTSLVRLRDPRDLAITIVDPELQQALVWWRRAAKRGSRQAQYELALCFRDGRGTFVDLVKALYWMRRAAEAGLPEAQLELGVLLVQELPTGRDETRTLASSIEHDNESFYWILRAAKNGLPSAQIELAQLFVEGRYVHRNASTAFYWFKRAAKAGHPYGQFRVASMLIDGEVSGGCVDLQDAQAEAVKWLKLASEQGWTDADKLLPVALGMANEESVKTHRLSAKYTY